jgi:hypothetical protein
MALGSEDGIKTLVTLKGSGCLSVPPAELKILYDAGMPSDKTLFRYIVGAGDEFGAQYKDFIIEYFGVESPRTYNLIELPGRQVTPKWTIREGKSVAPYKPGIILEIGFKDGSKYCLLIWRIRLFFKTPKNSAPYVEQLWDSSKLSWGTTIQSIGNPGNSQTISSVKKLADIMPLLNLCLGYKRIRGYYEWEIEEMINTTIDKMARDEPNKSQPRPFQTKRFVKHWPRSLSRTGIYGYVSRDRFAVNGELDNRYIKRCAALAEQVSKASEVSNVSTQSVVSEVS